MGSKSYFYCARVFGDIFFSWLEVFTFTTALPDSHDCLDWVLDFPRILSPITIGILNAKQI